MFGFGLVALMGLLVFGVAFDSSDTDDGSSGDGGGDDMMMPDPDMPDPDMPDPDMPDPDMPDPDMPDPDPEPDLGATLSTRDDGTIDIELGEDETGAVIALQTETTFSDGEDEELRYGVELLLVPEDVDLSAEISANPTTPLNELLDSLEVTRLATYDLGETQFEIADQDLIVIGNEQIAPPTLNVVDDTLGLLRATGTDSGDGITATGVELLDALGAPPLDPTQRVDLINIEEGGTLIGGLDADTLASGAADSTLLGSDGNDLIRMNFSGAGFGEDGNDTLRVDDPLIDTGGDVLLDGGAGNDLLTGTSTQDFADLTLAGGEGDDTILGSAFVGGLDVIGGNGNDVIEVSQELAEASGGAGDDQITVSGGAAAIGGVGDDELISLFAEDPVFGPTLGGGILTGGEGADTFAINTTAVGQAGNAQATITDYARGEDAITIETSDGSSISGLSFEPGATGTVMTFDITLGGATETQSVLVEGVFDLTADDVTVFTP